MLMRQFARLVNVLAGAPAWSAECYGGKTLAPEVLPLRSALPPLSILRRHLNVIDNYYTYRTRLLHQLETQLVP